MKKLKCVVAVPGDSLYLREQAGAAKSAADRVSMEIRVVNAQMDSVAQSQQLLSFIQGSPDSRPDAILIEPVSAAGLPRVAEAAVAAGIAWVVSNAQVEYIPELRTVAKAPVFLVTQDHVEIGRIEGRQMGALLPEGGTVVYLRGPSMSNVATLRHEGVLAGVPPNVEVKNLKVQGAPSGTLVPQLRRGFRSRP
jgi:ABC-type sugar transport system substrate-binding protein